MRWMYCDVRYIVWETERGVFLVMGGALKGMSETESSPNIQAARIHVRVINLLFE